MAASVAATETELTGILLCAGNPLLDISAEVPMTLLEKVGSETAGTVARGRPDARVWRPTVRAQD